MNRFPNLTEQEKDCLLRLFLTSGTLKFQSDDTYTFEVFVSSEMNTLDKAYDELILKAMNDLYSPV